MNAQSPRLLKLSAMYIHCYVVIVHDHNMTYDKARIRWASISPGPIISLQNDHPLSEDYLRQMIYLEGFIYVFPARSLVKIGMTRSSVYRRWHSIKTSNPWLELPLYVSHPLGDRVISIEKLCHEALAEYRATGEWFACDRQFAVETVRSIVHG